MYEADYVSFVGSQLLLAVTVFPNIIAPFLHKCNRNVSLCTLGLVRLKSKLIKSERKS